MVSTTKEEPAAGERAMAASPAYTRYVIGLLLVVGVFNFLDRQIFAVLLDSIKQEFALSDTELGLLGGVAFSIFYVTVGIPIAWLADRMNRRNIIALSVAMWSVMTALCGIRHRIFLAIRRAGRRRRR